MYIYIYIYICYVCICICICICMYMYICIHVILSNILDKFKKQVYGLWSSTHKIGNPKLVAIRFFLMQVIPSPNIDPMWVYHIESSFWLFIAFKKWGLVVNYNDLYILPEIMFQDQASIVEVKQTCNFYRRSYWWLAAPNNSTYWLCSRNVVL